MPGLNKGFFSPYEHIIKLTSNLFFDQSIYSQPDETWEPFITSLEPKGSNQVSRTKYTQLEISYEIILLAVWNLKSFECYKNVLTLHLVNPRHHIGKLKGFPLKPLCEPILMPIWNFCALRVSSGVAKPYKYRFRCLYINIWNFCTLSVSSGAFFVLLFLVTLCFTHQTVRFRFYATHTERQQFGHVSTQNLRQCTGGLFIAISTESAITALKNIGLILLFYKRMPLLQRSICKKSSQQQYIVFSINTAMNFLETVIAMNLSNT